MIPLIRRNVRLRFTRAGSSLKPISAYNTPRGQSREHAAIHRLSSHSRKISSAISRYQPVESRALLESLRDALL